jgi:hypothetical protein
MNHGGNIYRFAEQQGCLPKEILDFSANINPGQAVDPVFYNRYGLRLQPYADPDYILLKQAIKTRYPRPEGVDGV